MADITQIQVGSTTYDIRDLKHTIFVVKGTQTAKTNNWTGELPDVDELYEGMMIQYWLPFDGTTSSASLTLTLKDSVSTGAVPVYAGGATRVTTHQPVNTYAIYIYQTVTISNTSYTGWWMQRAYDSNTTYGYFANLGHQYGNFIADSVIYKYQLLFHRSADVLTPLNNNNGVTGTTKTMLTDVTFDPFGEIYYYNSTANVSANAAISAGSCYYSVSNADIRYSFNCGNSAFTSHKDVYMKISMQQDGSCKIAEAMPLTQTLPSTADGYHYIFLGRAYSGYQMSLYPNHPIYYHDGTSLRKLEKIDLATQSYPGLLSAADKIKLDGLSESYASLNSPAFTGTPTAPTAADGTNTTQIATTAFVQSAFKANDAMIFKGTIGSSGATVTTLPATHNQGWTYKVATAGTYAGQSCEVGDTIICVTDGTTASDAHWTVIQSNIDGAVTGPASSTDAHVATFNGTSGKIIKDSGFTIGKSVPSDAVFTDTTYTAQTDTIGSASAGTAISADDITAWDAGSTPTLGTAIAVKSVKTWSAGSAPTLGTAIAVKSVKTWSAGSAPTLGTAISADDITAWDAGSTPTLGTAISADDITAWDAGSTPTLGTAIPADDITAWSAGTLPSATVTGENLTLNFGTLPSLSYTAKSIPNVTSVGSAPSLSYTARTIPNVTSVGSAPSLSYTARTIPNVTSVGSAASLTTEDKSIPNVTSVGSAASLTTEDKSIPNVTSVGSIPSLSYTAKSIPNISVTSKTVVTGITES